MTITTIFCASMIVCSSARGGPSKPLKNEDTIREMVLHDIALNSSDELISKWKYLDERGSFEWSYLLPRRNGTMANVTGSGSCPMHGKAVTIVWIKTVSNQYEIDMVATHMKALSAAGMGNDSPNYTLCYLEPIYTEICSRTRRCVEKFFQGVSTKVAFAHDVLLNIKRAGHTDSLLFLMDTDVVALRPFLNLKSFLPEKIDAAFMEASPGDKRYMNTGFYALKPVENALIFLRKVSLAMYYDQKGDGPSVHDQSWAHVVIDRMGPTLFKWIIFPTSKVTGRLGMVDCNTSAYHAIYTRDYVEKRALMVKALERIKVCQPNRSETRKKEDTQDFIAFSEREQNDLSDSIQDRGWSKTNTERASICNHGGMREILAELRTRNPGTHGTATYISGGGGLGNVFHRILIAQITALVSNRTLRVFYEMQPMLELLVPTSAFYGWESNGSVDIDSRQIRYEILLQGKLNHTRHVVITGIPAKVPTNDKHTMNSLRAYLNSHNLKAEPVQVAGCLSAEFLRPGPTLIEALGQLAPNFSGKTSIGVHLRVSDRDMAIYMGNPTMISLLSRGPGNTTIHGRRLPLDYTGSQRRASGCITDFTFAGCIDTYYNSLTRLNASLVFFVAADSMANAEAFSKLLAAKNASVVRSPGHPTHTGRPGHTADTINGTRGAIKALVDFLLLTSTDYVIGNCPATGSSFSWSIFNHRMRLRSSFGLDAVCAHARQSS